MADNTVPLEGQTSGKIVHTVELDGPRPNIIAHEGTFKNKPMLNLIYLDGYSKPTNMGIGKIKMILHSLPELKAFYEKYKGQLVD